MAENIPFLTDVLELYTTTPEGLPLWKTKGIQLNCRNLLDNIFILTNELAKFFDIRHDHLCSQNIAKLQKEKNLPNHLPNFREMVEIGSSTLRARIIYGLTRHQTEHLIADFSGHKARQKKHAILTRLQSIETDVLKGAFEQARQKAASWDGVQFIKDAGFTCSLPNDVATVKDIMKFLKVPRTTLNNFLNKHKDTIKPIQLSQSQILTISNKARMMKGYHMEDVARIAVGMDTAVGIQLKNKLFGQMGTLANLCPKGEIEWREFFSKIFANLGLYFNYSVGKYRADFFVADLGLCLECNGYDAHKYYDQQEEEQREKFISKKYALVRFHHKVKLEVLINGILQAKQGNPIKLYEPEHIAQ